MAGIDGVGQPLTAEHRPIIETPNPKLLRPAHQIHERSRLVTPPKGRHRLRKWRGNGPQQGQRNHNAEDDARRCTQTARLRELQDEGIVERRVHPETPVRMKYVLTTKGQERQAVVEALSQWAEKWVVADHEPAH